ncbi:MAG: glycosyltransferase WbuB, partial [Clostridia bacterium]|nr:glycosyltransferase WbuB [Clostridia bacterium]
MKNIEDHAIYTDLLRCFRDNGHQVYTVSPNEKRTGLKTALSAADGVHMLHVAIGNITSCGMIEKGISTLRIETQFLKAIKKYFKDVKFDLVLYSTPPITFAKVIRYVKKRDGAKTYLLLKDIFPQNAVDLGMMAKHGPQGLLYHFFRRKEKKLYAISDRIGCMS